MFFPSREQSGLLINLKIKCINQANTKIIINAK